MRWTTATMRLTWLLSAALSTPLAAQQFATQRLAVQQAERESEFYRVDYLVPPDGAVLEVGGMDFLEDGRLVVSTRRGQVWIVENALADDPAQARFSLFAEGLDEGLGLKVLPNGGAENTTPGDICVLQRGELTRLRDVDGDGRADHLDTLANDWGVSGNYHEFAFGLPADDQGNLFMSLNVSFLSPDWWLGKSPVPWRGWVLQIGPSGAVTPFASGFRSPCGLGRNAAGDIFLTDNQGDWTPVCPLYHVQQGRFYGHPASLNWTDEYQRNGAVASDTLPPTRERAPAACWLPYKWSRSAGNLVADQTGGRFGPFGDQLLVAELTNGLLLRCDLEKVRGEYQGACFLFRQRVGSAARVLFAPDGTLLTGFTNRGWGGLPPADGLARVRWTGKLPFEMQHVHLLQDGFEITFTQPLEMACTPAPTDVALTQYDYDYWWEYGSPERHMRKVEVTATQLSDNRRTLTVRTAGLTPAMVARCILDNVHGADGGMALLHNEFAYTINQLPDGAPTTEHVAKVVAPPPPRETQDEGWLRLTYGDPLDAWMLVNHPEQPPPGWHAVDAEIDPQHPETFLERDGNSALVNAGAWPASDDFWSRYEFGDCQLHLEFMLPQDGESILEFQPGDQGYGLLLCDSPECGTITDCYGSPLRTPDFVAYKGPGEWHDLDVDWQAPRFNAAQARLEAPRMLRVLIDDVSLHQDVALFGNFIDTGCWTNLPVEHIIVRSRGRIALRNIRVRPHPPAADAASEQGWIPIFNGKDIEGWTVVADEPGKGGWAVEDGVLTGSGPRSHLFSPRGDYKDFQFRASLRISDGGNSGMYFRAAQGPGWPDGYEAQVNSSSEDPQRTGSLYGLAPVKVQLIPPGTWFTQEVTCRDTDEGTHITIAVNGIVVTDYMDKERRHAQGHVALQQHNDGSVVEYRSIEVRELP